MKTLDDLKARIQKEAIEKICSGILATVETVEVEQETTAAGRFNLLIVKQKDGKSFRFNMPCGIYTEEELKIVFDSLLKELK
jgi:hypothetical protein